MAHVFLSWVNIKIITVSIVIFMILIKLNPRSVSKSLLFNWELIVSYLLEASYVLVLQNVCLVTWKLWFCFDIVSGTDVTIQHIRVIVGTLKAESNWKLWRMIEAENEDKMFLSNRTYTQVLWNCSITVNVEMNIL